MPHYMTQASYTAETWKLLVQNPQQRTEYLGNLLKAEGGRLISLYYAFGEYDIVLIAEAPDNVTMASVVIAVAAGGAARSIKTTALMTADEGFDAITRAQKIAYSPPV